MGIDIDIYRPPDEIISPPEVEEEPFDDDTTEYSCKICGEPVIGGAFCQNTAAHISG